MSKNVLVISTTPRKNGNSFRLAKAFADGAESAGHHVTFIDLREKSIHFCVGCQSCGNTHACFQKDDVADILSAMAAADVIAFATPIYFYEMCGQMKTLLDRTVPLYGTDTAFRNIVLLATSQDSDPASMDGATKGLEGWIACFDNVRLLQVIRGTGADAIGDIENSSALTQAHTLGANLP